MTYTVSSLPDSEACEGTTLSIAPARASSLSVDAVPASSMELDAVMPLAEERLLAFFPQAVPLIATAAARTALSTFA